MVLEMRIEVNKVLEMAIGGKLIGASLDAKVYLCSSDKSYCLSDEIYSRTSQGKTKIYHREIQTAGRHEEERFVVQIWGLSDDSLEERKISKRPTYQTYDEEGWPFQNPKEM